MSTDRSVRHTGSRTSSAGNYTRTLDAADEVTDRVISVRDGDTEALENNPETASAATIKAFGELFARNDAKLIALHRNSDTFVTLHKEFLDTKFNGERMNDTLKAMFGDVAYSLEQYEHAYSVLRANNVLEIDQAEVVKQAQAAANQRAKAARAAQKAVPTEEQLYTMDLDELRRLDAVENQQRLQLAGERGGNGF